MLYSEQCTVYCTVYSVRHSIGQSTLIIEMREFGSMTDAEVAAWLESFDTVMTDCDGVLWVGGVAIPGSTEMVDLFRKRGKRMFYLTNNSAKHRRVLKEKLDKLGFNARLEECTNTAFLAGQYLLQENFNKDNLVYVLGQQGLVDELEDVGIKSLPIGPDPVPTDGSWSVDGVPFSLDELDKRVTAVICGFDVHLSWKKIMLAANYAARPNTLFVATNTDERFPLKGDGCKLQGPGTGTMVKPVAMTAGRQPVELGKPSRYMFDIIQKKYPDIQPHRTLMIGDNAATDIAFGKNCGMQTLLVGTGVTKLEEAKQWEGGKQEDQIYVPDIYIDKLGDVINRV
eukprot:GFUD01024364.1.p1 GENE.GFUD01024364.1~~GFUD01024364.1.p1  ORF type:complete len:341 (-),score=100.67 GFUD01024364.1:92-1114(-)